RYRDVGRGGGLLMSTDRQLRGPSCKWVMMAAFVAASAASLFATAPAHAGHGVAIALSSDNAIAPATITLSATSTLAEAIVDYRWIGLDAAPRCRGASCMLDFP